MDKQPSSVIIFKRSDKYYADVTGAFGGGYSGAFAGDTPEEAALFALRENTRYIKSNPLGGTMHVPKEVEEAMQAQEVSIEPKKYLINLPAETHERLRVLAFERRTTIAELVRSAVDEWLKNQ